jgi:hypothetical protein
MADGRWQRQSRGEQSRAERGRTKARDQISTRKDAKIATVFAEQAD